MTHLERLHQDILDAPTCMALSSELEFCRRLTEIEHSVLDGNWRLVSEIFSRLGESHTDAIYEMASVQQTEFFVIWLEQLTKSASFASRKAEIDSMIDMFSCRPS